MSYKHIWPCAIFGATLPVVAREPWCVCTIECMYHWWAISSMWHVTCLTILGCTLKNNILCVGYTCDFCLGINVSVYSLRLPADPQIITMLSLSSNLYSVSGFRNMHGTLQPIHYAQFSTVYSLFSTQFLMDQFRSCNTAKDWYQGKALV